MKIHVVSAEFPKCQWRAVKAFHSEEKADDYANEIYEKGWIGGEAVLDSRVDEITLED
jgi:hypothetical protein